MSSRDYGGGGASGGSSGHEGFHRRLGGGSASGDGTSSDGRFQRHTGGNDGSEGDNNAQRKGQKKQTREGRVRPRFEWQLRRAPEQLTGRRLQS